jgi:hypothetical protein
MGFGISPFGTCPYGTGTPLAAPIPSGRIFANGATGQEGSRRIHEGTGDYVFDDTGRVLGMSATRQMMLLALSTVKTSAATANLGHELRKILDIGPDFERRVRNAVESACKHLTDAGLVGLVEIRQDRFTNEGTTQERGVRIVVRWVDLQTDEEHTDDVAL